MFVFGHKFTLFLLLYSIKKFLITFIIPNHCLQVKHTTHCPKNNLNLRIGACHSWSNGICLVYGSNVRHLPLYSICSNCARFRILLFNFFLIFFFTVGIVHRSSCNTIFNHGKITTWNYNQLKNESSKIKFCTEKI